jgi:hypothetical protein
MATNSFRSSGSQINQRGVAQGNTLVDPKTGLPVDVILAPDGKRRLCVDAAINIGSLTVDVDLDVATDGVHIGNPTTGDILVVNPDGSINVNTKVDAKDGDNVSISGHKNPISDEKEDTISDLNYKEIYSYTSSNANTKIMKVECTCETPATFKLKINGSTKKILRTSSLERNVSFIFDEHRSLLTTQILTIEAQIDRQFNPSYTTFVSLEGYLA